MAARQLQFVKGPIFANVILADEINRTPPKTQAALLEAMQEHQVTAAGTRYVLEEPFFVLATQNPIEMEGTYPLPEAQLDRFMFNVVIDYLPEDDEVAVVTQTTSAGAEPIEPLFTGDDVRQFHEVVRQVPVAEDLVRYAVRLGGEPPGQQRGSPDFVNEWVSWGAGTAGGSIPCPGSQGAGITCTAGPMSRSTISRRWSIRHCGIGSWSITAPRPKESRVDVIVERLLETVKSPSCPMAPSRAEPAAARRVRRTDAHYRSGHR